MTRQAVREMKRALHAGCRTGADDRKVALSKECALSLLRRSINFGHVRLAVIRLSAAVSAGAQVPVEHWQYCYQAAHASQDAMLQKLFVAAAEQARQRVAEFVEAH
jgi:hypothetical protein